VKVSNENNNYISYIDVDSILSEYELGLSIRLRWIFTETDTQNRQDVDKLELLIEAIKEYKYRVTGEPNAKTGRCVTYIFKDMASNGGLSDRFITFYKNLLIYGGS
jgi:hypothetical protein